MPKKPKSNPPQSQLQQAPLNIQLQQVMRTQPPNLQALIRRALKAEGALRTSLSSAQATVGTLGMALDYIGAVQASILQLIKEKQAVEKALAEKK